MQRIQAQKGQEIGAGRPQPLEELLDEEEYSPLFVPSFDLEDWAKRTFVLEGAPLYNPDHRHLEEARVRFLWTNGPNVRQMRTVAGTAEIPVVQGTRWVRARAKQQLREWFGSESDFLITIFAPYAAYCSDAAFCALIEHELYHCAQERDKYGALKFDLDGNPVWGIRGHDVEEFIGVVRRYGAGNAAAGVAQLVEAASLPPVVSAGDIDFACGTCLR